MNYVKRELSCVRLRKNDLLLSKTRLSKKKLLPVTCFTNFLLTNPI